MSTVRQPVDNTAASVRGSKAVGANALNGPFVLLGFSSGIFRTFGAVSENLFFEHATTSVVAEAKVRPESRSSFSCLRWEAFSCSESAQDPLTVSSALATVSVTAC
jgi:hypothetical protein